METVFTKFIEGFAAQIGQYFKTSMPSLCDIETADTDTTLVTSRGTLVSGLRIDGMKFAIGPEEYEATVDAFTRALQSYLMNPAYTVDIFASNDRDAVVERLERLSSGARSSCQRMGLDLDDLITSNETALARYTSHETIYLALWTRESVLTPREMKDAQKDRAAAIKKLPAMGASSQNYFASSAFLRERHEATMRSIYEDLRTAGVACSQLTAHEMLHVARMNIDPAFTHADWKPVLAGDPLPVASGPGVLRKKEALELDFEDIQQPPVAWQMFPRDGERINNKFFKVGDVAYAPVFIDLPPREIAPFSVLFDKLNAAQVPWRTLFRIDGGGMRYMGTREAIAGLLSFSSSFNKRISESMRAMHAVEFEGKTCVRVRFAFCTWAPADQIDELQRRASRLAQTVSSWGQCEVRDVSGDPAVGFASTVPFFTESHIANPAVAPLAHISRMLPIMRPSSPWDSGAVLYRTLDGKVIPFQPGSTMQTTWNYILFGRPGFGKSVQMMNLLLCSILRPGVQRLPKIGIVDIGPSSQYFVEMVRDALPERDRHLVGSFRMRMTADESINPFDTPLGNRRPTPEHKAFLTNILTQIATPAERNDPYARMTELSSKVIDDVYQRLSDESNRSTPKVFSLGAEPHVDSLLRELGFVPDRETTWWQVVDYLFSKGYIHEATLAQRYAVPIMDDCASLSASVEELYGNVKVESGETLPQAFTSLLSAAVRDFPNLSMPTKFDIGDVRIAALNLEEVAKGGSKASERQTAVMYLLASYVLTKDYRINERVVQNMHMPPMYLPHHLKFAADTYEDFKWTVYDEFHKTSKSVAVQESVIVDMREGRKYNIGVVLSSQGADDFPPTMREFATGTFIVDAGSDKNARALQEFFGFNDTARKLLVDYVKGPKSSGAPLLASLTTSDGNFTQLLVSTLGVETRWALSTTAEDVMVRAGVCRILGGAEGRRALAAVYPNLAKKEEERLRKDGHADPIRAMIENVCEKWPAIKDRLERDKKYVG